MRTTFCIQFYCRKAKTDKQGLAPLELSIIINGERKFMNLPMKFPPKEFNKKKQPTQIVQITENYRTKINNIVNELLINNLPITANAIKELIRTGGIKTRTVEYIFLEYFKILKEKNNLETSRKYRIAMENCFEVIDKNREIITIKNKDILLLQQYLLNKYKESTAGAMLTKIKTVFTFAKDNDYLKINPFQNIKISKGYTEVKYLTENEIKRLQNLDVKDTPYLQRTKDLLLFQLFGGGFSYCDLIKFDVNNINIINGNYLYKSKRQKTGIEFKTIILPEAIEILDKYNNKLPIITNQKLNQYAKELAKLANINQNITSHLMRKSFATLLINKGISIETIAKCLGHSNTTITQKIYCTKTDEGIMNELTNKLNL